MQTLKNSSQKCIRPERAPRLSGLFKLLVYRVKFTGFPLPGSESHHLPGRVSILFNSLRFPEEQKHWLFNDVLLLFIKGLRGDWIAVSKTNVTQHSQWIDLISCKGSSVWQWLEQGVVLLARWLFWCACAVGHAAQDWIRKLVFWLIGSAINFHS